MPANTMTLKVLSTVTHLAGVLGTLGFFTRILVTYYLAKKHNEPESSNKK